MALPSVNIFVPTKHVRLGVTLPRLQSQGCLLNGDDAYQWILKRKSLVGWTYSYNSYSSLINSFERLISTLGRPNKKVKFASNVHIKCYIDKKEMLVGSFNLTEPTIEDMCVCITDKKLIAFMRLQFNTHWKALV